MGGGVIDGYKKNGASAQATGVMGDRISVNDDAGTQLQFSFRFDGSFEAPARDPNLNSFLQIGVFANLFVFDGDANDEDDVIHKKVDEVRDQLQAMIDKGVAEREAIFW